MKHSRFFKSVTLAAASVLTAHVAFAAGALSSYGGTWRGSGTFTSNGHSEPLNCRSTNTPDQGGGAINLSLICAGDSFKVDIRSDLTSDGQNVQGNWTETTQGASGNVSGTISGHQINASVTGGVNANIVIRSTGRRLDFALASQQGNVSIAMRK